MAMSSCMFDACKVLLTVLTANRTSYHTTMATKKSIVICKTSSFTYHLLSQQQLAKHFEYQPFDSALTATFPFDMLTEHLQNITVEFFFQFLSMNDLSSRLKRFHCPHLPARYLALNISDKFHPFLL